ncbi:MAG: tRNA lysidine(34) synthetase TilS [Gemmatimonadaceae bacterium]
MNAGSGSVETIRARLAALGPGQWLFAVSGGADSMVVLHAALATLRRDEVTVATFDHGTGSAASAAVKFVVGTAATAGVRCISGSAVDSWAHDSGAQDTGQPVGTEAHWRKARWHFLSAAACRVGARIATGHTLDDQVETVFMRALRGAGARGLAGLYASSPIARPLLDVTRADILAYASECNITFMVDPSNSDRRHLRNRVRLDLLPAIEASRPGFACELLNIARQAADLRARTEAVALTFPMMTDNPGMYSFDRAPLRGHPLGALRVLWPPLAARAGVIMDRRGTERLAKFTIEGETGQAIQLAGGVTVFMSREAIQLHTRTLRD